MKEEDIQGLYRQAQRLAEITKQLIMSGNIQRAKHCIQQAEDVFNKGTSEIKNAIANVYVYSVSTFMEMHHCNIKNLFPESLLNEYQKQINASSV